MDAAAKNEQKRVYHREYARNRRNTHIEAVRAQNRDHMARKRKAEPTVFSVRNKAYKKHHICPVLDELKDAMGGRCDNPHCMLVDPANKLLLQFDHCYGIKHETVTKMAQQKRHRDDPFGLYCEAALCRLLCTACHDLVTWGILCLPPRKTHFL